MTNAEKRRWFVNGLIPEIRREIQRANPQTFEEAQRLSLLYDRTHTLVATTGSASIGDGVKMDSPMDIDALHMPPKKLSDKQRRFLRENNGCFSCRKLGHISTHCPTYPKAKLGIKVLNMERDEASRGVQLDPSSDKSSDFRVYQ